MTIKIEFGKKKLKYLLRHLKWLKKIGLIRSYELEDSKDKSKKQKHLTSEDIRKMNKDYLNKTK